MRHANPIKQKNHIDRQVDYLTKINDLITPK